MAGVCFFCKKKAQFGNKVSHSNIKTRTRSTPNLRRVRHRTAKGNTTVMTCTRCLRSGKVMKPLKRDYQPAAAS